MDTPAFSVTEVDEVTPELAAALGRLVPQLSSSSPVPGREELQAIAASPATHLLIATAQDGTVAGMLTLAVFAIPTGVRAWIEDVVVDEGVRGGGVGRALVQHALETASAVGARTVDLTSRPSREAANRLYQRMGFALRETNVYRFTQPQG